MTTPKIIEEELPISSCEGKTQMSYLQDLSISVMSHELRTSLNAVIGITNLLLAKEPKASQIGELNILKFCGEHLLNILNDNLDFSKVKTDHKQLESMPLNLCAFARNIIGLLQTSADEKGNSLKLIYDDTIPTNVLGDKTRLYQILVNLLSNAIKFTRNGAIVLAISLKEKQNDRLSISFEVSDTGIGIPEDKQACVFESFTQADANIRKKYGGAGLGLAITKDLLDLHQSKINLESTLGRGSKFSFTIDFKHFQSNFTYVKSPINYEGKRILLVDDNEVNRIIAQQFLNKYGLTIDFAVNGVEAINKVICNSYDLVFMDIQMPGINGFETTKIIRQTDGAYFRNLPIIALTASTLPNENGKFAAFGLNGHILKPFDPSEIEGVLADYLGENQVATAAFEVG